MTSDSHLGLKQAVARVLTGATWQRCRVHFMRNALSTVPKAAQQMVAATLGTNISAPSRTCVTGRSPTSAYLRGNSLVAVALYGTWVSVHRG